MSDECAGQAPPESGAELERLRAENERLTEAIDRLQQTWAENAPAVAYKARAEAWERASQEGHPDPCTLGPLCPYCEIARLRAEVERLKIEAVRCEMEMGEVIDTRDEMESALSAVHAALGGDGEWACRVPSPPPPDSGNLSLDVPVLAAQALARAEAAEKAIERVLPAKAREHIDCWKVNYGLDRYDKVTAARRWAEAGGPSDGPIMALATAIEWLEST